MAETIQSDGKVGLEAHRRVAVPVRSTGPAAWAANEVAPPATKGTPLRRLLIVFDAVCLIISWTAIIGAPFSWLGPVGVNWLDRVLQVTVAVAVTMLAMVIQRLYLGRVCSVRAVELSRTSRAVASGGLVVVIFSQIAGYPLSAARAIAGAVLAFLTVGVLRGIYSSMLRERRARGLHARPIVIVGTNDEARELAKLVETHPEFGYRVTGVIGHRDEFASWTQPVPFLGTFAAASEAVAASGANGVLIAASALDPTEFNRLSREFLRSELHVHLSSGLRGIDHRRLRSVPLAHEPLFYLERISLSHSNLAIKRVIDIIFSTVGLIIASPVMLIAAIAIKAGDRGPVIFKQVRVGRGGKEFMVYKFRTMVPGAENMLSEVTKAAGNQRDGVLFKLAKDPRQTRVGRILEAASIDELPQMFNVLRGTMSLVGPRPALPREVAQFDEELLERLSVPPGITGLWQVEARDNPSFSAYRRLDLFYVENWSVTLDLAILVETVSSVISRVLRRN